MLMFVNGFVVGILVTEVVIAIAVKTMESGEGKEEFVMKLVKEKGWTEARWELETAFRGKYMRTWRKLYKKHIEEKGQWK